MGNFSLTEHARINGTLLADKEALFYVTQRKLPFAPCVGHERLLENLIVWGLDVPQLRFLRDDKAGLGLIADRLAKMEFLPRVRAVAPATIMFAQEPLMDIEGPFAETQLMEVRFEHAFDEPMTIAGRALEMRLAVDDRWLSDFSLRRDGEYHRAAEVAKYSYIGGFNDTSNMYAAFLLDLNAVGTMSHYYVLSWWGVQEKDPLSGGYKHFERVAFERWLDAHPKGTTLLNDTINVRLGTFHAIHAAESSESRRKAFKAIRIDSGDLIAHATWVRKVLDANGFGDVKIILTSDLDAEKIRKIVAECPFVYGFGIGTKLIAEVEHVAGIIFKLAAIGDQPVLKCSGTSSKATLPGKLQVWRYVDTDDFYIKDIITPCGEDTPEVEGAVEALPLIQQFFGYGTAPKISPIEVQRTFVATQLKRFRDITNYAVELSPSLVSLREELIAKMHRDEMDYSEKESTLAKIRF